MSSAVIVEAVRTPIGRRGGQLAGIHSVELLAGVLRAVLRRAGVAPEQVEDVVVGCVTQAGEQGVNMGRLGALQAGFPPEIPATTVNRTCGSSLQALHFAANLVESGTCDIVIAAGVESMTRVPLGSAYLGDRNVAYPPGFKEIYPLVNQGMAAELIGKQWGLSRGDVDRIAVASHQKAARATNEGRFAREIVPLTIKGEAGLCQVTGDEGIRSEISLERLSTLKPAFKDDGLHTAGNSSQISDGASAILVMAEETAKSLGLKARARILTQVAIGVDPVIMLTGPIPATRKLLQKAGLRVDQIDLFECNEAFASVLGAWLKEIEPDPARVNPNGGAIALGHPLGSTGCRLITTLLYELERTGGHRGVVTMCCGGGIGLATLIERMT